LGTESTILEEDAVFIVRAERVHSGEDVVQSHMQAARKVVCQNQMSRKRGHSSTQANLNGEQDTPIQSQTITSIKNNGPS
jgi:hypothetical protein